jgi:hypothetical protein
MLFFFRILKGFFCLLTVVVGILYMRGDFLFPEEQFQMIKICVVPGYLFFCGLMIGYLICTLRNGRLQYQDNADKNKIAIKSFVIGFVMGIILAVTYVIL